MNRRNQLTTITQMIQLNQWMNSIYCSPFFGKPSISLTETGLFLAFLESVGLIQSYQSLRVNGINHILHENELTQSPINSLGKGTESIQSILRKKWIDSNQSAQSSWLTFKSAGGIPLPNVIGASNESQSLGAPLHFNPRPCTPDFTTRTFRERGGGDTTHPRFETKGCL